VGDWALMDKIFRPGDPATAVGAKIIRPEQEAAIVRMMGEDTHSILLADAMGAGKTVRAAEWGIRLGFERVLIIGVKDTYAAWSGRLEAQSDGDVRLRRLDSTKAGREAFADFLAGKPGWFFSGSQWLTTQDYSYTKPEGAEKSDRTHLKTYAKMKPLDAIIFDECFVAGTLVDTPTGQRRIEDLQVGDSVYGFDHSTQSRLVTTVTGSMSKQSKNVLPSGSTVNHPYYVVGDGYRPAGDLTDGDWLLENASEGVRAVRHGIQDRSTGESVLFTKMYRAIAAGHATERDQVEGVRELPKSFRTLSERSEDSILWTPLRKRMEDSRKSCSDGGDATGPCSMVGHRGRARYEAIELESGLDPRVSSVSVGAHEHEKPEQHAGGDRESAQDQGAAWLDLHSSGWRKRSSIARRVGASRGAGHRLAPLLLSRNGEGLAGAGSRNELQDGLGAPCATAGYRVRWAEPQLPERTDSGCQEGRILGEQGVDDLAILEPRDSERYARVFGDNQLDDAVTVYNIETGSSNYFAKGLLVHNCHVVANRKSVGLRTVKTIKTDWKLAMSGTWYRNDFAGAWSVTRWLWPLLVDGSFIRWSDVWCSKEELYLPNGQTTSKVTGEKEPGAYIQTLPCYIREEALEELPEPEVFMVELTARQREQYTNLERDMVTWLDYHATDPGRAPLVADLPIVLRARLRTAALAEMSFDANGDIQFDVDAPSSKLWALRQIVDRPDWAGERVIIGTDSKRFAKVVVARMKRAGYNAVEWSGDVNSKQRDQIKEAFIAGEIQYVITVIPSFSTGLDGWQTVCSRMITLSASEDNSQNQQWLARCFRPGRVGEFKHVVVNAADTYDLGIFHSLNQQSAVQAVTLRVA
jgi:hypothetical protein